MIRFLNSFVKITAWLPQKFVFKFQYFYEDKKVQSRKIKGPAIIISNHTAVFDYAGFLFVFFGRTLRYQMAEVLFKKKGLGVFLKAMGGIYVDRDGKNFSFINESLKILNKGGVVGIFPESRIPLPDEEKPLPFKTSLGYLAINADVPVIPVYTNGNYFNNKHARVVIGKPLKVEDYYNPELTEKENIQLFTDACRNKIIELGKMMESIENEKK